MYPRINIKLDGKFVASTTNAKDLITARFNFADLMRIDLYRVRAEYDLKKAGALIKN